MNKILLTGRLAQDPQVRYTQTGKAVTAFTLAVNRFAGGTEQADFIPVVVWEKLAETVGNHLAKGSKVLVEGRLQIRSYSNAEGQKIKVGEVVASVVEFLQTRSAAKDEMEQAIAALGKDVSLKDIGEEAIPF